MSSMRPWRNYIAKSSIRDQGAIRTETLQPIPTRRPHHKRSQAPTSYG